MWTSILPMRKVSAGLALILLLPAALQAQDAAPARPTLLLDQVVADMPIGAEQEIRVLTATFEPGQKTPFHTHRFPVTVHVLDGEFVLEVDGMDPVRHAAGDTFVEPPNVKMIGSNGSADGPLSVLIFYVSDPETPFLDPIE